MLGKEPCPECGTKGTVVEPAIAVCGEHDCDTMLFRIDRPTGE